MSSKTLLLVSIISLMANDLLGQTPQPGFRPPGNNPEFQQGNDGPWNHRLLLAKSADGFQWRIDEKILVERGSVPELFLGPDKLPILLFVDASGAAGPGRLGAMSMQPDGSSLPASSTSTSICASPAQKKRRLSPAAEAPR